MASYRDDRDALREKADALEGELAGTQAKLDAAEEQIDAKDAELARLRRAAGERASIPLTPAQKRKRAAVLGGAGFAIVLFTMIGALTMVLRPSKPPPIVDPPRVEVPPVPPAKLPGRLHAAHFLGRITKVIGRDDVRVDQLCHIRASARGLGPEQEVAELEVQCDDVELYRYTKGLPRVAQVSMRLAPIEGDASRYHLTFDDRGRRSEGHPPQIAIESENEAARVFTDDRLGGARTEVVLRVDAVGTR